jgi:hypothetical protein
MGFRLSGDLCRQKRIDLLFNDDPSSLIQIGLHVPAG